MHGFFAGNYAVVFASRASMTCLDSLGVPRAGGHPTVSHQEEVWASVTLFIKGQVPVQQSMRARVRFAPNVAIIQSRPEGWTHWRAPSSLEACIKRGACSQH